MDKIRCLIADISRVILADIIQQIINKRNDIEVVYRIDDDQEIYDVVKDLDIDVVILGNESGPIENTVNRIMDISPDIIVVTLMKKGRRMCVCMDDYGPDELVYLVKASSKIKKFGIP